MYDLLPRPPPRPDRVRHWRLREAPLSAGRPLMSMASLLQALAMGERCSGTVLAQRSGITRAAIWKQVEQLRAQGFPIIAQGRQGYQSLWPIQLLDQSTILSRLPADPTQTPGRLELHWELDSTSSELQRQGKQLPDLAFVLAETQSAGRGRRGRRWLSPPGLNIYLSCYKRFERGVAALGGLPLAVGVMLVEALQGLGVTDIGLKWPNDIISPQGKLAGILVELIGESQGPCSAVIGVGVNLRLTPAMRETLDQTAADLHALLPADRLLDRNHCAAAIIGALCQGLRRFEDGGYASFHAAYTQHDRLQGSRLRLHRPNGSILEGIGAGTDAQGALQLATDAGLERIDSAEVSVRRR